MNELSWTSGGPVGTPGFSPESQTDWFTVRKAAQQTPESAEALEKLCRTYWYPLYAYVRRRGHNPEDAQDLTQEFFARLLNTEWLKDVHPSKGRFRCYLLASLNYFLANEARREQAQKRGGGRSAFAFDSVEAEERYRFEPAHDDTPDRAFERGWAATLMKRAESRLQEECLDSGRGDLFAAWKGLLEGQNNRYAQMAGQLAMSETAARKAAQKLRQRYQELLRAEVAQTVNDPADVDEELRSLFATLNGG
jgi:RNA polymerase sigma-70 factor (ECF subfamily)